MFDYGRSQLCFIGGQFVTILFFGLFTFYGASSGGKNALTTEPTSQNYMANIYPSF